MSAVRCPLLLKIATFSLKDSARTLSVCLPLRSLALAKTKLENIFTRTTLAEGYYLANFDNNILVIRCGIMIKPEAIYRLPVYVICLGLIYLKVTPCCLHILRNVPIPIF